MMPHDDVEQDKDMIANVLQKIVDEMHGYEADRIMPEDKRPKMSMGGIPHPTEDKAESLDQAEPENQDNQHEPLDPAVLKELMSKAEEAGEDGSLPEDQEAEFPSEIQMLIAEHRKKK